MGKSYRPYLPDQDFLQTPRLRDGCPRIIRSTLSPMCDDSPGRAIVRLDSDSQIRFRNLPTSASPAILGPSLPHQGLYDGIKTPLSFSSSNPVSRLALGTACDLRALLDSFLGC